MSTEITDSIEIIGVEIMCGHFLSVRRMFVPLQ